MDGITFEQSEQLKGIRVYLSGIYVGHIFHDGFYPVGLDRISPEAMEKILEQWEAKFRKEAANG